MRVINDALKNTVENWTTRLNCQKCQSELEVTASDFVFKPGVVKPRDPDSVVFTCPCCKKENWLDIDTHRFPENVLTAIKQRR